MNIIEELEARGLIKSLSNRDTLTHLLTSKQTIYCGFDPSASSLHIGNLVLMTLLKRFQKAGHRVIIVVGGGTGMIGDPGGRSSERVLLTKEILAYNKSQIKRQLETYIDITNPEHGIMVDNYDWLNAITFLDFLRNYGKHITVNYMLDKEVIKTRLPIGLSFTEFSYTLIQAVDFLHLYENFDCAIQIGGSDQWGNLTTGLELIHKVHGEKAEVAVLTAPLITDSVGKKFGKSEGGALFLDEELTSPYQLYQYFMNVGDLDAIHYLKTFTFLSLEEIDELAKKHEKEPHLRLAQKTLAFEMIKNVHGANKAEESQMMSEVLFSGQVYKLNQKQIEELFGASVVSLAGEVNILDALVAIKAASSKREAREFVLGNSILINGEVENKVETLLNQNTALFQKYTIVRRGKKNYYLIAHI